MAKLSFRWKIFWYFTLVIVIIGTLVILVCGFQIFQIVFEEAKNRVAADLRVAHSFFDKKLEKMEATLSLIAENQLVIEYLRKNQQLSPVIKSSLERKRVDLGFDILTLCDKEGKVVLRTHPPYYTGDSCLPNPLISKALKGKSVSGIVIVPPQKLRMEGEDLVQQAYIPFKPTPRAKPRPEKAETSGMFLIAAVPVLLADGKVIGALYGGNLLNKNYHFVDYVRDMVFKEKEYKGKPFGTVTLFQWDVRIATNVKEKDGSRAIGTRVSREVYERVLEEGKIWLERAFVVNNWYISAYEPIYDPANKIIGMLYVGVLEDKYVDIRNKIFLSFLPIIFGGIAAVLIISYLLSGGLSKPIKRLVTATNRIARGEMQYILEREKKYPKIHKLPYSEIQELIRNFNQMAAALYKRETELKKANDDLRQINRNYMEILGFVTHEIKNRLGIILGSAYNLNQGIVGKLNEGQEKMVNILLRNTERLSEMIKNYLDLSRIEKGELKVNKQEVDFKKDILEPVLDEFKGQFEARGILLEVDIPDSLKITADPDLLKIVMENLLSNAIKYGREKGAVKIEAQKEKDKWRVSVWNEGEGISKDEIDKLFTKFTRLGGEKFRKEQGSGLGLFVTKEIVQKHGGEICAESEEGKWAKFIFTLPSN
ncbi:hypothetical protein DRJ04_03635 [Candidatus Aerophobetes bacterium]|uniref:histidine kinase n=1 Tax=Aerophobetes bacterium TaxID=2030807 RepID=A0A662DI31_UNCAE|nr:MAG: hypothetical protein DRJ04_03635 [Candidatus Aerophobetes bacterium]